jgi:hypothetical protein
MAQQGRLKGPEALEMTFWSLQQLDSAFPGLTLALAKIFYYNHIHTVLLLLLLKEPSKSVQN